MHPARKATIKKQVESSRIVRPLALDNSAALTVALIPQRSVRKGYASPESSRPTKCGMSGRSFTMKSQAISKAPTANTTSPGSRIHCQNSVVS